MRACGNFCDFICIQEGFEVFCGGECIDLETQRCIRFDIYAGDRKAAIKRKQCTPDYTAFARWRNSDFQIKQTAHHADIFDRSADIACQTGGVHCLTVDFRLAVG